MPRVDPTVRRKVLICTEDPELYLLLEHILNAAGFSSILADSEGEAEYRLGDDGLLAVVFDGQAWHGDIVANCRTAKGAGHAVCALIGGNMRVTHLQMIKAGLDDGIVRPLDPGHLLDFLQLAIRQESPVSASPRTALADEPTLSMPPDPDRVVIAGPALRITGIEARILDVLQCRRDAPHSRTQLLAAVWPASSAVHPRTVDVHIARLRKALLRYPQMRIETIYGQGYMLVSAAETPANIDG